MNSRIRCRDLRANAETSLIKATYKEILEPSFSLDELDTLDGVLAGLTEDGSYECWGLCALDDETPIGCILGYPFPESRVLLIGYIAVRPKRGAQCRWIADG